MYNCSKREVVLHFCWSVFIFGTYDMQITTKVITNMTFKTKANVKVNYIHNMSYGLFHFLMERVGILHSLISRCQRWFQLTNMTLESKVKATYT